MAEVVPFPQVPPLPRQQALCGLDSPHGLILHVWDDTATVGDACQCGAQRLPPHVHGIAGRIIDQLESDS